MPFLWKHIWYKVEKVKTMERKNLWEVYTEEQVKELEAVCENYKDYLDKGKTERECIREAVKQAKEVG